MKMLKELVLPLFVMFMLIMAAAHTVGVYRAVQAKYASVVQVMP